MNQPELQETLFDVLIIGGGINGAGIARDAAGRGLKVCLCEKGDLAQGTSSASTKLIHGGLRYLEYFDFGLVKESLREREILLNIAPHIVWPMQFVIPYQEFMRPKWMIKAGLFLYDVLGGKKSLPRSRPLNFTVHNSGEPLGPDLETGFMYSDCWVQDARLVVLNAMDARDKGAAILTRTEVVKAVREEEKWKAFLRDTISGKEYIVFAKTLVNAAGPWADKVARDVLGVESKMKLRLVKGSHIVIPKQFGGKFAYLLQNDDNRVVFSIPYEQQFTLIGTTEMPYEGDPKDVSISEDEVGYLCDVVNHYFADPITPEDVLWSYSGVRPLLDDGSGNMSAMSREYVLEENQPKNEAFLLNIYGGKLTTYRNLAEKATRIIARKLRCKAPDWTAKSILPGGDIKGLASRLYSQYPWFPTELAERYIRHYGANSLDVLGDASSIDGLGEAFGAGVFEAELDYLKEKEWVKAAEDMLWRRTKLGLVVSEDIRTNIHAYFS